MSWLTMVSKMIGREPSFSAAAVDLLYHCARFFHAVDIRAREFGKVDSLKLGQQALAQGLGGNAGAIGDEKSSSFHLRRGP